MGFSLNNRAPSTRPPHRVILFGLIVGGLVVATLGNSLYKDVKVPSSYVKVSATVESISTKLVSNRYGTTTDYYPELSFAVGGIKYSFTSSVSITPGAYPIGSQVLVAYNPKSPGVSPRLDNSDAQSSVSTDKLVFKIGLGVAIIGAVLLLICLILRI